MRVSWGKSSTELYGPKKKNIGPGWIPNEKMRQAFMHVCVKEKENDKGVGSA